MQVPTLFQSVLGFLLIPVAAVIVGGLVATFRKPSPAIQSGVQHFAAGVVFAAVAVELLPQELAAQRPLPLVIGFGVGVGFMLALDSLVSAWSKGEARSPDEQPFGMLAAIAVDLAIDGLLIGVAFAAGEKQGLLITIALTLEVLFVGLSVSTEFAEAGADRVRIMAVIVGLGLVLAVGALLGVTLLAGMSGFFMTAVLAFGSAALLYLVTEELLIEAHEVPDTPLITATFFLGFLALLLIELFT